MNRNTEAFDSFDWYCRETTSQVRQTCHQQLNQNLRTDPELKQAVSLALARREASIYPLLFRTSYSPKSDQFDLIRDITAAIHLLQISTFVIDDIIDNSKLRNNEPTIVGKYGTNVAVVIGELLQSISTNHINQSIMAGPFKNKSSAAKLLNRITIDVYLGQFLDLKSTADLNWTLQSYLKTISLTTGAFLSRVSRSAALLFGRPQEQCAALAKFGYCYGMAVQIIDDVLDIAADSKATGKTFAADLFNRRMRIPYILALRSQVPHVAESLRCFFSNEQTTTIAAEELADLVRRSGVLNECIEIAINYTSAAEESIQIIDDHFIRSFLCFLCADLLRTTE